MGEVAKPVNGKRIIKLICLYMKFGAGKLREHKNESNDFTGTWQQKRRVGTGD